MAVADTDTGIRPARRVARGAVRGGRRAIGVGLILSLAFLAAATGLLALTMASGPVALPRWMTGQVETRINAWASMGRITIGRVDVGLAGGVPTVRLHNVGLFDARGAETARLNEVGATFDPDALMRGRIAPVAVSLSGAQITLRRKADGTLDLRFGGSAGGGGGGSASGSLASVLDGIDRAFVATPLAEIRRVTATELTITLEDARVRKVWQVTEGRLVLTQDAEAVEIAVGFDVFNGTEELATTALTFRSSKSGPAATMGATFTNAAARDIALQSPVLAFLGVIDAPISGAVRLGIGEDGQLHDFAGMIEIGAGALTAGAAAGPVRFDRGRADLTFDPLAQRIEFRRLEIDSGLASLALAGHADLDEIGPDGWPRSFVGQFQIDRLAARDENLFARPVDFNGGRADLRLVVDPFRLSLGMLSLRDAESTIRLSGDLAAGPDGPEMALNLSIESIGQERLVGVWPVPLFPKTREWLDNNILSGELRGAQAAFRRSPGQPDRLIAGFDFDDASVRWLDTMPPIEAASGYVAIDGNRLTITAFEGSVTAPEGGMVDVAGTVVIIPDVRVRPQPAEVRLKAEGPITAALSLLDEPPLRVMEKAGRPVELARGRASVDARIDLVLADRLDMANVRYDVDAVLYDVVSERIVEGREVTTPQLTLRATPAGVQIDGVVKVGLLPVDVVWRQGFGPTDATGSRLEGTVELSPAFLREFGIDLPPGSTSGKGSGVIEVEMARDEAPRFRLTSDLRGVGLRIDSVAWSKSPGSSGRLLVEGRLGDRPVVERIEIEAADLVAVGNISLRPDGGLSEARFSRLRIGEWLDAPVTLVGRGPRAQPEVRVAGGTLDLRKADFGPTATGGAGGPVIATLDRLVISEGIALNGFRGDFTTRGGFGGKFSGRLNGGGSVTGTVAPQNGGTAVRVLSDDAGEVLRDANLAQRVRGGAMELILMPTGQSGTYEGRLSAKTVRVRGTPALAELLNAVSVVGLLQQLNGDGLVFDTVEADFVLTPTAVQFSRASGVGASLGISVEGVYQLGSGRMDLRGVLSPIYIVNGIGQIFSRRGEGLFGFNYRVTGTVEQPSVSVNPLSILTPGMFREIFRAPPPQLN